MKGERKVQDDSFEKECVRNDGGGEERGRNVCPFSTWIETDSQKSKG